VLRESSGTTDEAEARKMLTKRAAEVTTRTHPGLEVERVKMTDATRKLERYCEEQAATRAENGHTLGILDHSEAESAPTKKPQRQR